MKWMLLFLFPLSVWGQFNFQDLAFAKAPAAAGGGGVGTYVFPISPTNNYTTSASLDATFANGAAITSNVSGDVKQISVWCGTAPANLHLAMFTNSASYGMYAADCGTVAGTNSTWCNYTLATPFAVTNGTIVRVTVEGDGNWTTLRDAVSSDIGWAYGRSYATYCDDYTPGWNGSDWNIFVRIYVE